MVCGDGDEIFLQLIMLIAALFLLFVLVLEITLRGDVPSVVASTIICASLTVLFRSRFAAEVVSAACFVSVHNPLPPSIVSSLTLCFALLSLLGDFLDSSSYDLIALFPHVNYISPTLLSYALLLRVLLGRRRKYHSSTATVWCSFIIEFRE